MICWYLMGWAPFWQSNGNGNADDYCQWQWKFGNPMAMEIGNWKSENNLQDPMAMACVDDFLFPPKPSQWGLSHD